MALDSNGQATIPSILDTRQVVLEWPTSMRIGDVEVITLIFEPIPSDTTSSIPQGEFTNVYNNYNIMAEARFEVAGISVNPANPTRESMPSGDPVKFNWQIKVEQARYFHGNVWLSLRFLPLDGSHPSQVPIFVREVDIHAASLFRMGGPLARLLGSVGIILGVLIMFDDMISLIRKRKGMITAMDTKDIKDFE